jgi:hypothetical protein
LQKSIDVPSLVVTSIKSSAMQDNSNKQGAALSSRQEKKLKMRQAPDLSCSLQDIMKSQQPDETGSRAPSVAGSGEGTFEYLHKNRLLSSKYTTPTRNLELYSGTAPNSMPRTIKVNESEESQMSSSIPGLGSSMDMSMNAMTREQEITLVKLCVTTKMFSYWKFYSQDGDGQFTLDPTEMCGFLIRHTPDTKTCKNERWWLDMRTHVTPTLTNHRNNVIKSCMNKFKGK